jgi:hypothetical protein
MIAFVLIKKKPEAALWAQRYQFVAINLKLEKMIFNIWDSNHFLKCPMHHKIANMSL